MLKLLFFLKIFHPEKTKILVSDCVKINKEIVELETPLLLNLTKHKEKKHTSISFWLVFFSSLLEVRDRGFNDGLGFKREKLKLTASPTSDKPHRAHDTG